MDGAGENGGAQSLKSRAPPLRPRTTPSSPAPRPSPDLQSARRGQTARRRVEEAKAAKEATADAGGDDHGAVPLSKSSLRVSPTTRAAAVAATAAADEAALAAELERARQKFAGIDADRSGKLSRDEVAALAQWALEGFMKSERTVQMTPEQLNAATTKLLAQADADGDGELNFAEFEAWFTPTCQDIQAFRHRQEKLSRQKRAYKRDARPSARVSAATGPARAPQAHSLSRDTRIQQQPTLEPEPEPEPEPELRQVVPEATPPRGKRSSNGKSQKAADRRVAAMAAELDLMTSLLDRVEDENKGLHQETASLRQELESARVELAKERARADAADARAREAEASSPHLGHAASRLEKAQTRREQAAAVLLQANWRGRRARTSAQQVAQAAAQERLQASPRLRAAKCRREHTAATLVQAHWRGSRTRASSPEALPPVPEQAKEAGPKESGDELQQRLEQAERNRDRLEVELERVTSDLRAQAEAAELKQSRAATAVETLVAGLVERAEVAEARAAAAEAAMPPGATLPAEDLTTEADEPLSHQQISQWAQELDTIVRLEELLRASEGTVKLLQHGVSETVASLKQQSPVKRKM
jgi:hypothetical protein